MTNPLSDSADSAALPAKVAIVGAGNVGATYAYALLLSGLVPDVVLVNRDRDRAEAEAADLNHAGPFSPSGRARAGDYADIEGAFLCVLTAGASVEGEGSRLDLAGKNAEIFRDIVPRVVSQNPNGLLLLSTNPVDILMRLAIEASGLPPSRVLGSGTILDSARLRFFLAQRFGVDERSIEALVLGEHGESGVPLWSACRVAGMPLEEFAAQNDLPFDAMELSDLWEKTVRVAGEIADGKGATFYGVATAMLKITEAIVRDANLVLPIVTRPDPDAAQFYGTGEVALSLPCIVNRQGAHRALKMPLSEREGEKLRASALTLEQVWQDTQNSN